MLAPRNTVFQGTFRFGVQDNPLAPILLDDGRRSDRRIALHDMDGACREVLPSLGERGAGWIYSDGVRSHSFAMCNYVYASQKLKRACFKCFLKRQRPCHF